MTASVKRQWKHFVAMPSGRRFEMRHRLRRARSGGTMHKILVSGLGGLIMIAGVAMLVLPGPGLLTMVVGAAIIAEESRFAARMLDRLDRWGNRHYHAWRERRGSRG